MTPLPPLPLICSREPSPAASSSDLIARQVLTALADHEVTREVVHVVDGPLIRAQGAPGWSEAQHRPPAGPSAREGATTSPRSRARPSRRATAQVSGGSTMVPLSVAVDSRSSASVMTRRCSARWKGTPKWWPIRKGTNTARGGFTCSVTSRATLTDTVGTPRRSIAR